MGWPNPKKEVQKAIDRVLKPAIRAGESVIDKAADKADDVIDDSLNKARGSIKWNLNKAKEGIRNAQDTAEKELREVGDEIEDGITEKLPELVEDSITEKLPELVEDVIEKIREETVREAMKKGLDVLLEGIEMLAPTRVSMTFGMALSLVVEGEVTCTITIPNPVAKLTEVRKWAKNPPSGRADIMDCFRDFGPESIGGGFKICGNGPDYEWDGDDKYDRIDAFLAKHGVD